MFEFALGLAAGVALGYFFPKAMASFNARIKAKVDNFDLYN